MKLTYQIEAVGVSTLKAAFRSIEGEAKAAATRELRMSQRTASARVRNAQTSAAKEAKASDRARIAQEKNAIKAANAKIRADEKASAKQIAIAEKTARHENRIEERSLRWRQQMRNRHFQQEERQRRRSEVNAQKMRERTFGRVATGAGRIASAGKAAIATGAMMATGLAANAVMNRAQVDTQLRGVANQGFREGDGRSREDLYGAAKGTVDKIANTTGAAPEQLTGAMTAILGKTGDFDTAIAGLEDLNKLAMATGTSLEDLGAVYGGAVASIKRGGATTEEAIKQSLELSRVFAGQGKFGEIEVSDLASQGGKIVGAATMFAGDRSKNLADMGALTQMAAQGGAHNAEDATTAVKNFVGDSVKKGENIGVNVWADEGKTKLRAAEDILADSFEKTNGNLEKLIAVYGEQSRSILVGNVDRFNAAGGGKAGAQAIRDNFANFRGQVMSQGEVNTSAQFAADAPAAKFAASMNRLNQSLGDNLLPKLPELVDAIGRLTPHITSLVSGMASAAEWFAENPFKGMGLVIAGYIGEEIVAAKIGDLLKDAISGNIPSEGGGSGLWGTAKKAAGYVGAAGRGAVGYGGAALAAGGAKIAAGGALAVGALGTAAVASVGYAGYQGYKLSEEVSGEGQGNMFSNLMKIIEDGKRNDAEAAQYMAELQEMNKRASERMMQAADKMASSQNRTTPMAQKN
jgi:hypothetical protein